MYYRVSERELYYLFFCEFSLGTSAAVTGIAGWLAHYRIALASGAFAVFLIVVLRYLLWGIMVERPQDESIGD